MIRPVPLRVWSDGWCARIAHLWRSGSDVQTSSSRAGFGSNLGLRYGEDSGGLSETSEETGKLVEEIVACFPGFRGSAVVEFRTGREWTPRTQISLFFMDLFFRVGEVGKSTSRLMPLRALISRDRRTS
jgi:hypothetical protein